MLGTAMTRCMLGTGLSDSVKCWVFFLFFSYLKHTGRSVTKDRSRPFRADLHFFQQAEAETSSVSSV